MRPELAVEMIAWREQASKTAANSSAPIFSRIFGDSGSSRMKQAKGRKSG